MEAVKVANDLGYHHTHYAYIYQNKNKGELANQEKLKEQAVKREDLFIISKLCSLYMRKAWWREPARPQRPEAGLSGPRPYPWTDSLANQFQAQEQILPGRWERQHDSSDTHFLDTWEAMKELVGEGLMKAIEISNLNHLQIKIFNKPDLKYKPDQVPTVTYSEEVNPVLPLQRHYG